ncbi:MAG: transcription elongation factor GreA, partial [Clostridia bacterium]|nr:transcription elongation factor GreA [Clostridia bacterium]
MMAKSVLLTAEGLKQLEEELDLLKGEKRKEIAEKIKVA